MSCTITIKDTAVYKALKRRFGTNETEIYTLWNIVVNNDEFNEGFQKWQQAKRKTSEPVTLATANTRTIVNDIIGYANTKEPDGNLTVINRKDNASDNYNSVADRRFCIKIVGAEMLDIFRYRHYIKFDPKKYSREDYIKAVRNQFAKRSFKRFGIDNDYIKSHTDKNKYLALISGYISLGEDKATAQKLASYANMISIIRDKLGKDITVQDINFLATFEEMITSVKDIHGNKISDTFFKEVFSNSNLNEIRKETSDNTDNYEEDKAQENEDIEFGIDVTEDSQDIDESYDESIRTLNNHDGQYATFITHVGGNIRSYLNSLRKLNGTGQVEGGYSYNTDNPIGIADTMSANECAMMLYTRCDYTNVDSMIKSIRKIAEQITDFEAFAQLADDLTNNSDFAYEFYRTFGKMVAGKKETYIENGERKTRLSNNTASRIDSLKFEYMNSLRNSATDILAQYATTEADKLQKLIDKFRQNMKNKGVYNEKTKQIDPYNSETDNYKIDKANIIAAITENLKRYFPTVDANAIKSFINNNTIKGKIDEAANMSLLYNNLKDVIEGAHQTYLNHVSKVAQAAAIARQNRPLLEAAREGLPVDMSKFKNPNDVWVGDMLTEKAKQAAMQLANYLVRYSIVKTELNSRNAKGNLSSDVINNSMISNFMAILQSELNTENNTDSPIRNYAAYKFRSKQYINSNILVEKTKDGVVINKGLFRLVDGKYIPTPYATELIKMSLFNGISDFGRSKSAVYSEMSRGDYVTTAMINFFNSSHTVGDIVFSDYMMRTPSDAPKNFIMTAPRYKFKYKEGNRTIEFWQIENEAAVNKRVQEFILNLPHDDVTNYEGASLGEQEVSLEDAVAIITGTYDDSIRINKKASAVVRPNKASRDVYINLKVGGLQFIAKGIINESGNTVENIKLHGLINNFGSNVAFDTDILNALTNYYKTQLIKGNLKMADGSTVRRRVNRQHPIFQQLYAVFQQEMQNAATAISHIFDNTNGHINFDAKGRPAFNDKFSQLADPNRATFANYHRKDNTYIDKDGKEHKETGIIQNVWIPVRDEKGKIKYWEKTNRKRLSGNVFTSNRFTIFDENLEAKRNFLQEVISEDRAETEDGMIHFLYGGTNAFLHINSVGEVEFTPAQQALIENKIEDFINAYVENSIERANAYSNLLEGTPHSEDDVAEFALNYHLAYINCDDIFEGDSKFYKSTQDFLKRAKEVQGSGVPYGIVDISRPMFGEVHKEVEGAYLNSDEMQAIVGKLHNCKQFTTFRGVTVTNTIRTSKESQDILVKQLTKNFMKEGLNEETATKKAKAMMKGYKDTKVNDAQSYITFEEWIRRIAARGQLHKYKPLIEAILDESKPLDVADINEFIQVQKNFYFDMNYNEDTGVMAPRQIKNAEFVLVPRLIKGTELEVVYNKMIRNGIDQLNTEETSKAGKVNVLTLWDNNGNLTKEWENDFDSNVQSAIETFSYNYLYTQQETPQHVNSENKAGIQIMKKIIDNISEGSPLWDVKQDFLNNYAQNIYESFANLMTELKVNIDENGHIVTDENGHINGLDYNVFLSKLEDEMIRLGLDKNMLDFVTPKEVPLEDKSGQNGFGLQSRMPAFFNSNRKKLESVSQAVFNNSITRQKLPGFHAAQITQIGFKPYGKAKKQSEIKGTHLRELKYHPNGKRYVEIMLPANAFGMNRNDAMWNDIRKKYEEEGKTVAEIEALIDEHMLEYLANKKLDTVIGYRIPTEGKQSVCIMKVVGFTPDAYGSTIVVPDDWVAQTGSDFDIDSVYGIQYSTRKNKDGSLEKIEYSTDPKRNYIRYVISSLDENGRKELLEAKYAEKFDLAKQLAKEQSLATFEDYSKQDISLQNNRAARNNRILDDMIEILQSDASLEENLSQSQFKDIITARDAVMSDVDADRRNARSPYNFFDQAEYQEDAMSGAKLKAFSVTLDTFCSVCNTVKPVFASPIEIVYNGDKEKFEELQKRFDEKTEDGWKGDVVRLDDNHILVKHRSLGYSNDNKNVEGKILTVYSSQTTAHILDAIKEGSIKNVNDLTFGVYKLFPNIGSDYTTAVSFMMQPGITEIVEAYNRNKSIYAYNSENPVNAAIKSIAKKLGIKVNKASIGFIEGKLNEMVNANGLSKVNVLNSERLIERIKGTGTLSSSPVRGLLFDYLVAKKYRELSNIASKINSIARVCNPDRFGAKQTIFATNQVFSDIHSIILDDTPVFSNKDGKSFLESIYPGISIITSENNVDAYINNESDDSSYKPLHYFLKYSTATSVKINSQLFVTQRPNFKVAVKLIQGVISGANKRISEETYNAFERYILCDLYSQIPIVANPVTYSYKNGIDYVKDGVYFEDERERIFGYGRQPNLKTINKNGEYVDFAPADLSHPTEEEIEMFCKFTPAQKVYYIQKHFKDGLICKYLKTNLVNNREYRKNKAGAQTIEFIEDATDRESIYNEFRNTFCNTNPLLALTAMDIIKYAFIVEGYQISKNAVNKVIDNDILINEKGFEGTGIEASLCDIVGNFADNPDLDRVEELTETFVRGHSNMNEISHTYVSVKDSKRFNFHPDGILTIFDQEDNKEFLTNHGIGFYNKEEFIPNKYIKIKFKNREVLYKIKRSYSSDVIYLTPLNLLQDTESSVWSANMDNNHTTLRSPEYYSLLLDEFETNHETWNAEEFKAAQQEMQKSADKYKAPERKKFAVEDVEPIDDWDINDSSIGGISILKQSILNHFNGTTSQMLIVESLFLQNKIRGFGIENGVRKIVDGNPYYIYRLNTKRNSDIPGNEGRSLFDYTSKKGLNKEIADKDKPFANLIETARQRGIDAGTPGQAHINYAYAVIPAMSSGNPETRDSSIIETLAVSDKAIRREASNEENLDSERYVQQMSSRSIEGNKTAISNNVEDVAISSAEYVTSAVDKILNGENGLNLFTQDENGQYLKITDPKVMALIRKSPALRRKYLKTLLKAKHLINIFQSFAAVKYEDNNPTVRHYVDKINQEIKKLSDSSILEEAEELYVTGYLASISTNPNIQNNIISLLDNYHSTGFLTSWIDDTQNTSNPIIQIITSDVMSDIRAKEFQGERRVRDFLKFMKNIKAEAARNGRTINWNNLVDEYGKWINDYNDKFIEDLEALREAKDNAYTEYKNATNEFDKFNAFKKYLHKKLDYDKWKLANVNQELVDDYYRQMIELEESMINSDTGEFTDIYVQYKILNDKLRDILSHKNYNGTLDEHFETQKQEVLNALANLKSDAIRTATGEFIYKTDLEEYEVSNDPVIRRNQNINSLSSAVRLRNFINKRNELNDEYYTRTERFGFKEQLEKYLSVVRKYENSGRTEDDLFEIPEYATAKNWIKQNAHYEYMLNDEEGELSSSEAEALLDEYFDGQFDSATQSFQRRVKAALMYLKNVRGERNNRNAIYKRIAKKEDARDANGDIDARKFTKEEIDAIRKEQEARFGIGESVPYSERSIIHSATTDDTVYTSEFYQGMKVTGINNAEYLEIVKKINSILRNAINPSTGALETSSLSIEEINAILDEFAKLGYDRTEQVFNTSDGVVKRKGVKRKEVLEVKKFIEKNVEFVLSEEDQRRFEAEKHKAKVDKGGTYYLAWCELNQEWDEAKQQFVPNHLLWGHAQPKSTLPKAERDKFISKKKTAALRILREVFTERPTKYYQMERSRMLDTYGANSPEFKAWEAANHIYNPHTHKFEPLVCWMTSEPNDNMPGEWIPNYQMTDKGVKEEYANTNFKKGLGVAANYKNNGGVYQRNTNLNPEERKVKEEVQSILAALATTKKAKRYIEQGNLPTKAIKESKSAGKLWLVELAKGFGWVEGNHGKERWDSDISYDTDYVPDMPMLQQLVSKDTHKPPYREAYDSDEAYNKAKKEYEDNKAKFDKENREIHKSLIDRDWETVIAEFISKASHFNAVQDNKLQLYFGQKLIEDIKTYKTRLSNPTELVKDTALSTDEEVTYKKEIDKHLQEQYANFVRRVIFDQYKKNQGKKTRFMTVLQGITSTNYMTLNVRGGIANVLVGESNIWGEMFAKEYFGTKDWLVGKQIWLGGVHSYILNAYSDTSTTLADAIVKAFNVIDYGEITGLPAQADLDAEEWSKRIRNAAFSPQTAGEHFMQNAAMFSMMMSHRVVANPKFGQPGEPQYIFMNKEEFIGHNRELALPEDELDNYREFIQSIKNDVNKAKDYAWFRNDPVTYFVTTHLSIEKQNAFKAKEKEIRKKAEEDFVKNPTLYSQFKLGEDGKLAFADGSILSKMAELTADQEVNDAYKLMGKFRERVISVNKKIHGNYGKLDSARLESEWFGGLLMQYHKHLYPGIVKRYRRKGYWNEERGTVEKGSYVALYDFLRLPIKQIAERNRLSEGQTESLGAVQMTFKMITDYLHFVKLNWAIMPQYERANIRRVLGDLSGMLLAIAGAVLLRLGWDDDDDSIPYNLGLYEMDRLASETFMWNPIGFYSEAKKLWSSPVAAQSIIGDMLNIMGTTCGILLEGEDYDLTFNGGRYHGENKLKVYIERRIPYWRNIVSIRDIADNNHYYKMGDNLTTWLGVDEINKD